MGKMATVAPEQVNAGNLTPVSVFRSHDTSMMSMSSGHDLDDNVRKAMNKERTANFFYNFCKSNPLSKKGQRIQMAKILTLTMVPIIALTVLCIVQLVDAVTQYKESVTMRQNIEFSTELGRLIHYLQKERDMTAMHKISDGVDTKLTLNDRYKDTNIAVENLSSFPSRKIQNFESKKDVSEYLEIHRQEVAAKITNVFQEIRFYTDLIRIFVDTLYSMIKSSTNGKLWQKLVTYQLLIVSKEDTGVERTLGGVFYSQGNFYGLEDYMMYLESYYVGRANFKTAIKYDPGVQTIYDDYIAMKGPSAPSYVTMMRAFIFNNTRLDGSMIQIAVGKCINARNCLQSTNWLDNMTVLIDAMDAAQQSVAGDILERVDKNRASDRETIITNICLVCLACCTSPLVIIFIKVIIGDIQRYAHTLADRTMALNKERKRADSLLYQMLPRPVAEQLKRNEQVKAESYESTTIFFSDIVGFTTISSQCTPFQVVTMLNNLYSCFDARISNYDVYKVETIGDAYMVASGVPKRNGQKHVSQVATMSLDLLHHINHLEIPHLPGQRMKLRAGLHSGPVVAGVVGTKMPRYCLFGDTVNSASRMESNGLPNRIHISGNTFSLLMQQNEGFECIKRGDMKIKGKGIMETYLLLNKKDFERTLPCMPECEMYQLNSAVQPGELEYDYDHGQ